VSEENETLLCRYMDEVWHKRNLGPLEEQMSPDFLDHEEKGVRGSAKGVRRFHGEAYRETFPHADVTVEEWLPLP
jgi:hypothetical protein